MGIDKRVTLSNGVKMPYLGFGVFKLEDGEETTNAVKIALETGYRGIDTASYYGNEESVGRAIKESGVEREDLFITSKVWNDEQGYNATLRAFERSLERLQTDYLDLYLIHWPVPGLYTETWQALEKLYHEGKVCAVGVSNFEPHHLEAISKISSVKPVINQIEFHPELLQGEVRDYCRSKGIQVEAWSPLKRGQVLNEPVIQTIGKQHGKTPAQVVLRWCLQHDIVLNVKSSKEERIKENADLFDFELTEEEMVSIDSLHTDNRIAHHPDSLDFYEKTVPGFKKSQYSS
ncbi:aldo/keto reductase [Guptibacillus hwajinpoensis]|uniref:Diketogulonate reductase-like aldo/keto reductase n=1 Tax=Guptibacillus hwajinpoensis TaxID=208199 RepID=A0ABU0K2M7_9BACL|nr:aldo/keto reductase [Alkalihalobacillus hemicentroti]MDQ0483605.1 diketogulonate reductase-like aldo/keto reductase [Alkalihalobacillus hemicentroti]